MTQPLGFKEHPIITLEWTFFILKEIASETRKSLQWRIPAYEFSPGRPVKITPELHAFVVADKIASIYDFYHASVSLFESEECAFEGLAGKALLHCSGLIDSITKASKDGGRDFDDRFTWPMVEAFPQRGSTSPQEQVQDFLSTLLKIEAVLERKLAHFEVTGPGGGSMQRAKQLARQQILQIFKDCWNIEKADGANEPAKIPSVFVRFANPVWHKITGQHLADESLARAYRDGAAERDSAKSRHGLASTEELRAEARRLGENAVSSKPAS